jgi:hypothetical protein
MPYGPANFQSTVVKPYYTEKAPEDKDDQSHNESHDNQPHKKVDQNQDNQSDNDTEPIAKNDDQPENQLDKNVEPTAKNEV